jgi:hypothetical protein
MSRTYRKNERYFTHYKGEYYNDYFKNRSMKIALDLHAWNEIPRNVCNPASFFRIVKVGDGDNYGHGCGGDNKKAIHRIDRARYRNALNRSILRDDFDRLFDVKPAYDTYDWS